MREKRKIVEIDSNHRNRSVNEAFSGGEKKRNEIFQMLEPKLSILDETDSGLTLRTAEGEQPAHAGVEVASSTHYERLLDIIKPEIVHALHGGPNCQRKSNAYDWIKEEVGELLEVKEFIEVKAKCLAGFKFNSLISSVIHLTKHFWFLTYNFL